MRGVYYGNSAIDSDVGRYDNRHKGNEKMKLFVYYNLHKHKWSNRDCKTRRVIDHSHIQVLRDVAFKVSEAGRRRVLKERRKNVHAGCEGMMLPHGGRMRRALLDIARELEPVTYDPYKYDSFVRRADETPVIGAEAVVMINKKVFALNPY